jgi:hypothetical protein
MKLFRSRRNEAQVPEVSFQLTLPSQKRKQPIYIAPLSLNAEQKSILETPVDPRVGRIMNEIEREKIALERAVDARRIVHFPHSDTGESEVIKDESGYWRIVPGDVPTKPTELSDAL